MSTDNAPNPPTSRKGVGLRPILQGILAATVIPSVAVVALLISSEARDVLGDLAESHFETVAQGATAKIQERLGPVPRDLSQIEFLLNQHDLNFDDADDIKTHLLTQAVGYPVGTLLGYGSVDGNS